MTRRGRSDAARPGNQRTCLVDGCDAVTSARRPFCAGHWRMLPGRTRSSLSMSVRFSDTPIRRQALARAAALLEGPR